MGYGQGVCSYLFRDMTFPVGSRSPKCVKKSNPQFFKFFWRCWNTESNFQKKTFALGTPPPLNFLFRPVFPRVGHVSEQITTYPLGMGYGRFMGYAMHFPAHQLGGHKMLWDKRGYGFAEVWVKRGSTVYCVA